MAEAFLSLDAGERADILRTVAARSGRSAIILEKDIWVCWVLDALFSMPEPHPMAFKGGTSLSKVYGIIDRFSEDVDVTLDYRAFNDGFDPFADDASRNQIRLFSERLKARVASYIRDVVAPALGAAAERLAAHGGHEMHIDEDGETIRFAYPSAVEDPHGYVRSEVLLEFGGRNVIDPNEQRAIVPDIAALTPDLDYPTAVVTVLSPARTFWEKATLIHVECHRRRLANRPERLSRHWYDLTRLAAHDIGPGRARRPRTPGGCRAAQEGVFPHRLRQLRSMPRRPTAARPRRRPASRPANRLPRHARRRHRRRRRTWIRCSDRGNPHPRSQREPCRLNRDGHRLAPQPAHLWPRTLPCCAASQASVTFTPPHQPAPRQALVGVAKGDFWRTPRRRGKRRCRRNRTTNARLGAQGF